MEGVVHEQLPLAHPQAEDRTAVTTGALPVANFPMLLRVHAVRVRREVQVRPLAELRLGGDDVGAPALVEAHVGRHEADLDGGTLRSDLDRDVRVSEASKVARERTALKVPFVRPTASATCGG